MRRIFLISAICLLTLPYNSIAHAAGNLSIVKQMINEGDSLFAVGEMQEAITKHQETVLWAQINCGQISAEFALAFSVLASDMMSAGQIPQAFEMIEQAEQIYSATNDSDLYTSCMILANKATIFGYSGKTDEALALCDKAENILSKAGDTTSTQYISILNLYSAIYHVKGDAANSLKYSLKAYNIDGGRLSQAKPVEAVNILQTIAVQYKYMGRYEEAEQYYERAKALCLEKLSKKSLYYSVLVSNMATLQQTLGNYDKAIELYNESLRNFEETGRDNNLEYATLLGSIASIYIIKNDYERGKLYINRCLEKIKAVAGTENAYYYVYLSNAGIIYQRTGEYQQALNMYLSAIEGMQKIGIDVQSESYLASVVNAAGIYHTMGQYSKAISLLKNACDLTLTKNTIAYATTLSSLGELYRAYGQLDEALSCYEQAAQIIESKAGKLNDKYALCMSNTGALYANIYDYDKAAKYAEEALNIDEQIFGEDNAECATELINLGVIETSRGNYERARQYLLRAISISKNTYGDSNIKLARALNSMAILYDAMGDAALATDYYNQAAEVYQRLFGENNISYVLERHNLATRYIETDKAAAYSIVADNMRILNNIPDEDRGQTYYNLLVETMYMGSNLYIETGDTEKAKENIETAMEIAEEQFGKLSKEYITGLSYMSDVSLLLQDPYPVILNQAEATDLARTLYGTQSVEYIKQLTKLVDLQNYIPFTTKNDKNSNTEIIGFLSDNINRNFTYMTERERENYWLQFESTVNTLKKSISRSADNNGLLFNAALLEKGLLLDATIGVAQKTQETNDPALIKLLEQLRALRVEASILNDGDTTKVSSRVLTAQADSVERLLLKGLEKYHLTGNHIFTWQQIQSNLKKNEAAVEFVHYRHNEKEHYAASVIRQGWKHPQNILLFTRDSLTDKTLVSQDAYNNSSAYSLVWEPLMKHLKGATQIYFSPAGILHQVGIEYLQNEKGDRMNRLFSMSRLSSTKELAAVHADAHGNTAAVFGAADFDMDTEEMEYEADAYSHTQPATRSAVDYRGQMQWLEYLPGTKEEINAVSTLLQSDMHYNTTVYSGKSCVEESFKSLTGHSASVIHIATHGFCLTVPQISYSASATREDLSLLYSGLAFAGANNLLSNSFTAQNIDDGILTSREVAQTDLRHTDMVVLSACQTGLGLLSGEGVFGLQRAFKKAGVRSMLVSLWEVSDMATQMMMTFFYQEIAKGQDYHTALSNAQSQLRQQTITLPDGTHQSMDNPLYWAAFVLLD